jgi:hypothetical protein
VFLARCCAVLLSTLLCSCALCSHSHPQPKGGSQAVTLTDDGLPIRPGQRPCKHYMKFGWCLFKQDCWYSHPPNKDTTKRSNSKAGPSQRDPPLFQSELEPGWFKTPYGLWAAALRLLRL